MLLSFSGLLLIVTHWFQSTSNSGLKPVRDDQQKTGKGEQH